MGWRLAGAQTAGEAWTDRGLAAFFLKVGLATMAAFAHGQGTPSIAAVTVSVASATSLRVSWSSGVGGSYDEPVLRIRAYDVRYRKRTTTSWTHHPTTGTPTSTTITGLTTGDIYYVKVRATDGRNWSAYVTASGGYMPDAVLSSLAPAARIRTGSSVDVSWTAPRSPAASGYDV